MLQEHKNSLLYVQLEEALFYGETSYVKRFVKTENTFAAQSKQTLKIYARRAAKCFLEKVVKRKFVNLRKRLISLRRRLTYKIPEEKRKMIYCPECGGEMQYLVATKHYVCKSCGLSVTQQELMDLRDKNRPSEETEEEQKENRRKEYLKWWLSKK